MRVALFTDVFPRLSNTFIINQITGLIDKGADVHIYARSEGDFERAHEQVGRYHLRERMHHIPVPTNHLHRLTTAARRLVGTRAWSSDTFAAAAASGRLLESLSLVDLYTALSFLPQGRYDVVHCQFAKLGPTLAPLIRARGHHEPLVISVRGADLTRQLVNRPRAYRKLIDAADLFLPVSRSLASMLRESGCPEEKIRVHHSGMLVEKFPFGVRRAPDSGPVQLLFIGRLTEKKGLEYGLQALAKVVGQGLNVELTVIGRGPDEEALRSLAGELGIEQRVRWLGGLTQDEVIKQLERAHLLMAPSVVASDGDQEGIPNVLKEAMATGIPVLATRHSGIPELVAHDVSGVLVPERDSQALARGLEQLISHPESWARMGRAGREKVELEFDSDRLNDELLRIYRCLAGHARERANGGKALASA